MSSEDYRQLVIEWVKARERINKKLEEAQRKVASLEQEKAEVYADMIELTQKLANAEKHLSAFLDLLEGKKPNERNSRAG